MHWQSAGRLSPGRNKRCLEALQAVVGPSLEEPGTRLYQLNRGVDDPRVFFLYEVYEDEDAFQAHAAADRFQTPEFREALSATGSRERVVYETIDGA